MLFADKLGMPKKIKDLAESLDLEVTNHHDPEFDAKLCAENGAYPPNQNGLIHPQLSLKWA